MFLWTACCMALESCLEEWGPSHSCRVAAWLVIAPLNEVKTADRNNISEQDVTEK